MQRMCSPAFTILTLVLLLGSTSLAVSAPARGDVAREAGNGTIHRPADDAGSPEPEGAAAALRVVPDRIPFQGFLTNAAGDPVNGTVNLSLRLWNAPTGGSSFWSEDLFGVMATEGVFKVEIGSVMPLDPAWFDGSPIWLGVKVFGGSELTPRTEFLTAPFAFHALTADNVPEVISDLTDVSTASPGTGQVLRYNGSQWAPGTIATGSDGDWTISGINQYSAVSGNVGIGVGGPNSKLSVSTSSTQYAIQAQNLLGSTANFLSPSASGGGSLVTPAAVYAKAEGADNGGFFTADSGVAFTARLDGPGTAIRGWDFGGEGLAGDFDGEVEVSGDVTIINANLGVGTYSTGERLHVNGNVNAAGGDFYAAVSNGVFNVGGGIMNSTVNVIADATPVLNVVNGDEDLFIEDNLEVGGNAWKPGGGSWQTLSDMRLKKDIRDFDGGLETILKINPIWFRYNDRSGIADGREHVGVSAQAMLEVAPFTVREAALGQVVIEDASGKESVVDPGEGFFTYDSSSLVYMLVNAVQEQQKMLDEQRQRIDALEAALAGR